MAYACNMRVNLFRYSFICIFMEFYTSVLLLSLMKLDTSSIIILFSFTLDDLSFVSHNN